MLKPYRTPQTYFRRRDRNQRFEHENDADVSLIFNNVSNATNNVFEKIRRNHLLNAFENEDYWKGTRL